MYWDTLYLAQWRIFAEHIAKDQQEEGEKLRDLAEYIMAFHNYEAVQEVQRARDSQARLEDKETTDIFLQQVANLFGKPLDNEDLNKARDNALNQPKERTVKAPTARNQIEEDLIKVRHPKKSE